MRTSLVLLSLLLCGLLIAGCTSTTTNGTTAVATASTPTTQVTNTDTSAHPPQQNRVDRVDRGDPAGPLATRMRSADLETGGEEHQTGEKRTEETMSLSGVSGLS